MNLRIVRLDSSPFDVYKETPGPVTSLLRHACWVVLGWSLREFYMLPPHIRRVRANCNCVKSWPIPKPLVVLY